MLNFGSMKAKVIRAFTCVNTRVYNAVGSVYEADAERINTLVAKGYLQPIVAHIPKAEVVEPTKNEVAPKPKKKAK